MEIVLGFVIIVMILLILGVGVDVIIFGFVGLMFLVSAASELFFLYYAARLLFSKRRDATFVRIDCPNGGKFDKAYYIVGELELPNVFPCEFVMRDKLYKTQMSVRVRVDANGKQVYDRNAFMTIVLGAVLCAGLCAFFVWGMSMISLNYVM